jgi:hypothetical protein
MMSAACENNTRRQKALALKSVGGHGHRRRECLKSTLNGLQDSLFSSRYKFQLYKLRRGKPATPNIQTKFHNPFVDFADNKNKRNLMTL